MMRDGGGEGEDWGEIWFRPCLVNLAFSSGMPNGAIPQILECFSGN